MKLGRPLALFAVCALPLAACGSGGSSSKASSPATVALSSTPPASTTSTVTATPPVPAAKSTIGATSGTVASAHPTITVTQTATHTASSSSSSAPSTGPATFEAPASGWAIFTSPTGKNTCSYQQFTMACLVSDKALKNTGGKHLVTLSQNGVAFLDLDLPVATSLGDGGEWATSGSVPTPPALDMLYTLPYGSSLRAGNITCASATNGFTCSNSVGSFTVNSEGVTRN